MVEQPPLFSAYYGDEHFDADVALAVAVPESVYVAFRGPLAELDGLEHEIDLADESDWVVHYNCHYIADEGLTYGHYEWPAGTPGLTGTVRYLGTRDPLTVGIDWSVGFQGRYDLPGFAEIPEVGVSLHSTGLTTPEEVRRAGGGR